MSIGMVLLTVVAVLVFFGVAQRVLDKLWVHTGGIPQLAEQGTHGPRANQRQADGASSELFCSAWIPAARHIPAIE